MSSRSETHRESRLACVVSEANGEDPAGSGTPFTGYLLAEVTPPWKRDIVDSRRFLEALREAVERVRNVGVVDKFTGLLPDPEYSREGHIRILYFRRPPELFAAYEKEEYVVPENEAVSLVEALADPDRSSRFARYRVDLPHIRDLLVCTHGSRDVCCSRFGYPISEELRRRYTTGSEGGLRVWRTSHLGGHRFAPNLMDLPEGRYWGRLEAEVLENLVFRDGPVSDLRRFYRGWSGLRSKFEQIAEREILAREGWGWTEHPKMGRVLKAYGDRVEVRIDYKNADGSTSGAYEATVQLNGSVATLESSGTVSLSEAEQYEVRHLKRVL